MGYGEDYTQQCIDIKRQGFSSPISPAGAINARELGASKITLVALPDEYRYPQYMMTSSDGNIFRVNGPLCGEFTGHRWNSTQRPVTRSFDVFFDVRLNKRWANNREVGDLRRHRAHYDVIVMYV